MKIQSTNEYFNRITKSYMSSDSITENDYYVTKTYYTTVKSYFVNSSEYKQVDVIKIIPNLFADYKNKSSTKNQQTGYLAHKMSEERKKLEEKRAKWITHTFWAENNTYL